MEGKELEQKALKRNKKIIESEEAKGKEENVTRQRSQRNVVHVTKGKSIKKVSQGQAV